MIILDYYLRILLMYFVIVPYSLNLEGYNSSSFSHKLEYNLRLKSKFTNHKELWEIIELMTKTQSIGCWQFCSIYIVTHHGGFVMRWSFWLLYMQNEVQAEPSLNMPCSWNEEQLAIKIFLKLFFHWISWVSLYRFSMKQMNLTSK